MLEDGKRYQTADGKTVGIGDTVYRFVPIYGESRDGLSMPRIEHAVVSEWTKASCIGDWYASPEMPAALAENAIDRLEADIVGKFRLARLALKDPNNPRNRGHI